MAAGPKDTPKMVINMSSFEGGESVDFKNGVQNSFYKQEALDFRSKASQMSVLPGVAAISGASSVLVDLPVEMVQDPSGVRWLIGDQGNLYKLDTTNTLTKVATCTDGSGTGLVYNQLSDYLYITGQQTVSMYGPITTGGTPTLKDQQFAKGASVYDGVVRIYDSTQNGWLGSQRNNAQSVGLVKGITATSQVTTNSTTTYTVPNTLSETSTNSCPFSPDIEPFFSIAVYLSAVGTGNATLTLHDGFNRQLAQVTINNSALVVGYNEFVFPAPGIRSFTGALSSGLAAAYHWHIESSVASDTMTVGTLTASDVSTADFLLFTYRMVKTNNTWHPSALFTTASGQLMCIGNGQYLSTYNFANDANPSNGQWQQLAFPIDPGYEICGLSVNNQYLVIAAEKRSTSSTHNYQQGALYFWDGASGSYNFKIEIPMGAPYSVYTFNNITYFICAGYLYAWGGGQQVIKVRPIDYQNTDYLGTVDTTIINPNMMAPRYNLLLLGYPSSTTNTSLKYGVYSWGSVELVYPNSFGYSYALSSGIYNYSSTNNLQIGMIKNFVDTLFIASRSTTAGTTTYQLDMLNNSSTPAANFNYTSLIYDGGARYKQKKMCRYKVSFLPWPSNATLTVWYSINRAAEVTKDPVTGTSFSPAAGDTSIVIDVPNGRFYEGQWGFYGTTASNVSSPPTFTGVAMEIDPLIGEENLRSDDQAEGS